MEKIEAQVCDMGNRMASIVNLSFAAVGVRLLADGSEYPNGAERLEHHRYCQALMKARGGMNVTLDGVGISCPAAASAFGFRPLPPPLQSGKGLVGFGIVSKAEVGQKMFLEMPRLDPGEIQRIHLFPLNRAEYLPDVVVVEDEVEKLMWIVLSYLHAMDGDRVESTTAVLQATCVDATVIPYKQDRLNFSYGCYGCRDATDIGGHETVLGFPGFMLPAIVEHLEFLKNKAIPTSRSKKALASLRRDEYRQDGKVC
ncbi:MAG: DUF169 domain-containing protein [Deltaproteobacteria bacterium]|nr:DUF169 domain-containing protein [Deltaproteobacteria bacterium]MBW2152271.1 DUF169 domain-containing protein [Deltaproteobacteria bacterium]